MPESRSHLYFENTGKIFEGIALALDVRAMKPFQAATNVKIFKGIAFAHDVRAMKPFQCRHKCQNKRNFFPLYDKQAIASALATRAIL